MTSSTSVETMPVAVSPFLDSPDANPPVAGADEPRAEEMAWLGQILDVVRERKAIDFSGYRHATLLRRVRNRMIAARTTALPEYLELLRTSAGEADALIEKLTIKVSRFFRGEAAFAALEKALARRIRERPGRRLKVWSAGCGQGEEPYSLAILLDRLGQALTGGKDILGTDIDPAALAFAAAGAYPPSSVENLDPELQRRYFDERVAPKGTRLVLKPEVRASVELRLHDLTSASTSPDGATFDLICCRNVLIYLKQPLQERIEALLAGSLRPGGLLLLGEAEWPRAGMAPQLNLVDRKARLFERPSGTSPEDRTAP